MENNSELNKKKRGKKKNEELSESFVEPSFGETAQNTIKEHLASLDAIGAKQNENSGTTANIQVFIEDEGVESEGLSFRKDPSFGDANEAKQNGVFCVDPLEKLRFSDQSGSEQNLDSTSKIFKENPMSNEPAKKRGRKPKGGKLTLNCQKKNETVNTIANIILHLKCSINDLSEYNYHLNKMVKNPLEYDPTIPPDIYTYNNMVNTAPFSMYEQERHTNENTASSIVDQCMLQTPTSYLDSINYSRLNEPTEIRYDTSSQLNEPLSSEKQSFSSSSLNFTPNTFGQSSNNPTTNFSLCNDDKMPLDKFGNEEPYLRDFISCQEHDNCQTHSPCRKAKLSSELGQGALHPNTNISLCNGDLRSPETFGHNIPAYSDTTLFTTKNKHNNMLNGNIVTEVANDIAKSEYDNTNIKDINAKLKRLKIHLYKNNNYEKKSACFWCTYDYDNPTCYIPKYEMDDKIYGYGSFCRPECAVAYLMKENIDDSMKFERYHLLNQIYSKIYDFK